MEAVWKKADSWKASNRGLTGHGGDGDASVVDAGILSRSSRDVMHDGRHCRVMGMEGNENASEASHEHVVVHNRKVPL